MYVIIVVLFQAPLQWCPVRCDNGMAYTRYCRAMISWQSHDMEHWSLGGMNFMIPVKACVKAMARALARGVCGMALPSAHRDASGLHDTLDGISAQGHQLPICGHAVLHVKRDDLCISWRVRSCAVTCVIKASTCPLVSMSCSMSGMMPYAYQVA
jgi:hypothetical protein